MKGLAAAAWGGAASARKEVSGKKVGLSLRPSLYVPMAVGAALGAAGAAKRRRRSSTVAVGGAVGTVIGLGAAVAWASRHFATAAARAAVRNVNAARDAHWLELNPIDYA